MPADATRRLACTLLALLLAACAASAPEIEPAAAPADPRPIALRLALTGKAAAVFDPGAAIPVEFTRDGVEDPVTLDFADGALDVQALPPGDYTLTRIGPLACAGIGFSLAPGAEPRALGTLSAEILQTDYDIALISGRRATPAELSGLGPGAEDAPLSVHRQALCHSGRGGTGIQFQDLSPAEQVMAVIFFGGFCAIALANGGFCAF